MSQSHNAAVAEGGKKMFFELYVHAAHRSESSFLFLE